MQKSFSFSGRASNPAKKKASPAQLAARKKFVEMVRSGAFKKSKRAADRDKNPMNMYTVLHRGTSNIAGQLMASSPKQAKEKIAEKLGLATTSYLMATKSSQVKINPAKKRATAKVKSNPMEGALIHLYGNKYGQVKQYGNGLYTATILQKVNTGIGEEMDYYVSKEFKTKAGAARWLAKHNRMSNPLPQVSETILQQLGGNKFIAMTGASRISGDSTHLSFKLPRNTSKANAVGIYYDSGSDTYTMKFFKQKGAPTFEMVLVEKFDDVYADMLRTLFTDVTGLETSLGTMGRRTNPAKSGKKTTRTNPSKRTSSRSAVVPNPAAKKPQKVYRVSIMQDGLHTNWMGIANFFTFTDAEKYSRYLSKQHPNWAIKVHDTRVMK